MGDIREIACKNASQICDSSDNIIADGRSLQTRNLRFWVVVVVISEYFVAPLQVIKFVGGGWVGGGGPSPPHVYFSFF